MALRHSALPRFRDWLLRGEQDTLFGQGLTITTARGTAGHVSTRAGAGRVLRSQRGRVRNP